MPIYEYICQECGDESEAIQKMSDDPLTDCDTCGASALTKKISRSSFILKGSGWYATDYKDNGKPKAGSDNGKDASEPADGGGTSESKPSDSTGSSVSDSGGSDAKKAATSPS